MIGFHKKLIMTFYNDFNRLGKKNNKKKNVLTII